MKPSYDLEERTFEFASRKEAKESGYWLRVIRETNSLNDAREVDRLMGEAGELMKILSAIAAKSV